MQRRCQTLSGWLEKIEISGNKLLPLLLLPVMRSLQPALIEKGIKKTAGRTRSNQSSWQHLEKIMSAKAGRKAAA
jgi:hypothetical protein